VSLLDRQEQGEAGPSRLTARRTRSTRATRRAASALLPTPPEGKEGKLAREKLKGLEELQRIDLQIRDLSAQAEAHPARLKQIEGDRSTAQKSLDALRGKLADNERARRQNEQLLQLEKDKVRKWESRLNELKTPREYAALARELDIAKKTNETADEEIRRLAGEYEELKKATSDLEKAVAEKETVVQSEG